MGNEKFVAEFMEFMWQQRNHPLVPVLLVAPGSQDLPKLAQTLDLHYLNETAVMPLSRTQFLAKVRSALQKAKAVDSPMTIINHLREPWLQLLKGQAEVRKLVQPKELIAKLGHLKQKAGVMATEVAV